MSDMSKSMAKRMQHSPQARQQRILEAVLRLREEYLTTSRAFHLGMKHAGTWETCWECVCATDREQIAAWDAAAKEGK